MLKQCFLHILLLHKESSNFTGLMHLQQKSGENLTCFETFRENKVHIWSRRSSASVVFHINQFSRHHNNRRSLHVPSFSFSDILEAFILSPVIWVWSTRQYWTLASIYFSLLPLFLILCWCSSNGCWDEFHLSLWYQSECCLSSCNFCYRKVKL